MNDTSKHIIDRIKAEDIQHKSGASFIVANSALWIAGILFVATGAIATAIIIQMNRTHDWELMSKADGSPIEELLSSVPYFWIAMFIGFIIVAELALRHTKRGYRWQIGGITLGLIGISVLLGFVGYRVGLGETIDTEIEERLPIYGELLVPRHRAWISPDHGRLAGKVILIEEDDDFILITIRGDEWTVHAADAELLGDDEIELNTHVRIVGEQDDDDEFEAEFILVQPDNRPFGKPVPPRPAPAVGR